MKILFTTPILLTVIIVWGCSSSSQLINISELEYPNDLKVVLRADWGWQPLDKVLPQHSINKITIHHGGEEFAEDKDMIQYLRNLQSWSRSEKKWIDIPYHFMIDLKGNIYEARPINYPGDTNTDYDVTGHALICVVGNYEVQTIKPTQLKSLAKLVAFLKQKYHVELKDIKGHKDYTTQTVCPGKDLYKYLADVPSLKWL